LKKITVSSTMGPGVDIDTQRPRPSPSANASLRHTAKKREGRSQLAPAFALFIFLELFSSRLLAKSATCAIVLKKRGKPLPHP
jgi:hypothetical protein